MENRTIKGFIFDLDGVLVFTDKYHYLAWKKMADDMGIYFDAVIHKRLRGVSRMESLEIILERYHGEPLSQQAKDNLAAQKNAMYVDLLKRMTPADVSEKVRNTLTALREKGYKIALGSSSKNAKFILEKVGLTSYFDAISDGTNISKSKPDPEVFLKAAQFLDLKPEECIVVEDAEAGIDAAKAGNMLGAGIGDARDYEKTDFALNNIEDLLRII